MGVAGGIPKGGGEERVGGKRREVAVAPAHADAADAELTGNAEATGFQAV